MGRLALAAEFPEATREEWLKLVEAGLKGRAFDSLRSKTADGIVIEPLYETPDASAVLPAGPSRTSPDLWCLTQRADLPDLAAANAQMLDDLGNGAGGIALVAIGAVTAGAGGLAIAGADDLARLLDGVELDLISLRLDGGGQARALALAARDAYRARNFDPARCKVAFGLDPVGSFALNGRLVARDVLVSRFSDTVATLLEDGFAGSIAIADGRVYHGAGASEAQELGFAVAGAVEMLRLAETGEVELADLAPKIGMMLTADADQFVTIAKLRAARLVWARLLEASGLPATPLDLHVETAARMMSRYDPHVNLLRTTTAAFAAGCGGADSVTALPFTHALGQPDGFARRLARNIQNLLLEESRIGRTIDPAAGSGYVESLTDEIAKAAWAVFQEVEAAGGMLAALQVGLPQRLIGDTAAARMKDIARRKIGFTGVSEFPNLADTQTRVLDFAPPPISASDDEATMSCVPLAQASLMAPFERLRDAAGAQAQRPTVFLATLGKPADFTPRLTWMTNLLAAGGIAVAEGPPEDFAASGCTIACLCSSDALYAEHGAAAVRTLKDAGARYVAVAGRPGELEATLTGAGIGGFIFVGQDVLEVLRDLQSRLGIEGGGA